MIIQRLDLKAFGFFTDVSIDLSAGPSRFHLVYGPNESGKSTSMRAISSLFFGMPHTSEDNYVHTNTRLRVGGLLVDRSGNTLECVRRRGRKGTLRDAADAEPVDEGILREMLGGIDRDAFCGRFGLSHDELTAGGEAILRGDGDLGEMLFAAGAGVGRLRDIQSELDEASSKLFAPRASRTINSAISELDKKRKELRQAQLPPAEFVAVVQQIEAQREQSRQSEKSLELVAVELGRLKSYQQASPLVPRWRSDRQTLAELGKTPALDDGFSQRRRQIETERQLAISQHGELDRRIDQWRGRLEALSEDAGVMLHADEIQSLFQELGTRDKADRDRVELQRIQKRTDRQITDLLRDLSIELLTDDECETADLIEDSVQRLRISDSLRTQINELAAKYERRVGQRDDAGDDVETINKRLAELNQELQRLGTPGDPTSLAGVMDSVGAPAVILESLAQQQDDCDQLRRECESSLKRLDGFSGNYAQAARLQLPVEAEINRASGRIREAQESVDATQRRINDLQRQLSQAQRALDQQQDAEPLPTMAELGQARADRDRLMDRLVESVREGAELDACIADLRAQIHSADQIADTMRIRHQEVHQRALDEDTLRSLQEEAESQQTLFESYCQQLESAQQQWAALWRACGVIAASPERMTLWISRHQQLVQSSHRLNEQTARLRKLEQSVKRSCKRLRLAIQSVAATKVPTIDPDGDEPVLFDDHSDEDLVSLYDDAVALRGELLRVHQQYETIGRRRDELAEELPVAETRLATHQKNVQQWQDDWRRVTESFADSENATPTVVLSMMRHIDELCDKKRERDILATRIRSIGEDDHAFASRVGRVAESVGLCNEDLADTGVITQTLYQRLLSERVVSRQREGLREQIEESVRAAAELNEKRDRSDVMLRQLCEEAGCNDAAELPEIERRSVRRLQLESSLRDLQDQLAILAGEQPIEEFVEAVGQQNPALLEVQLQRKESQLKDIRESISAIDQQIGALQHQRKAMDGGANASNVAQSMQLIAAGIAREAEEFARLRLASLLLRRAIDHYRRENQSPVLAIAERTFCELTCDEYQSLKVDFDAKGKSILFGVRRGNGPPRPDVGDEEAAKESVVDVPAPAMSTGTADALYLSLRLASLRHQLSHGPAIPLIVDDCLIQLDDARCVAALKALSELSSQTQVILFTHHAHLIDLAEAHLPHGAFHVHRLDALSA
jgi:uncharacterized protein YhaN